MSAAAPHHAGQHLPDLDSHDRSHPRIFRPGPVVHVSYTGMDQVRPVRDATMFGPTSAEALSQILRTLGRGPREVAIILAPDDRSHPGPQGATLAVLSARQGEGRWPLAFLWVEGAALSAERAGQVLAGLDPPEPYLRLA